MSKQLWNEGRVVGYSAYEIYLKYALEHDPKHTPASEKQWLASMMAMGSAMLLEVNPEKLYEDTETYTDEVKSGVHYCDIQLPPTSKLCAANTIFASLFLGEASTEHESTQDNGTLHIEHLAPWCAKITSYGPLIQNDDIDSPDGETGPYTGEIPPTDVTSIDFSKYSDQIREYVKIIDGIVIQPGTWTDNEHNPPAKDFTPDLSWQPRLRLAFSEEIKTPFYLLLVGFTNRTVVSGVTGYSTAVNTSSPEDGDFLGPWQFPWANKIIFSVPSAYIAQFLNNNYTREMESGTDAIAVKSDAIIDYKHDYDEDYKSVYYSAENTDATLPVKITNLNISGEDTAVIASYMHSQDYTVNGTSKTVNIPPALYGGLVDSDGEKDFIPLDTVAPGSLKLYNGDGTDTSDSYYKALTLEEQAKGTTAFLRKDTATDEDDTDVSYVVYELNQDDELIPVSDDYVVSIYGALSSSEPILPYFALQHNDGDRENYAGYPTIGSRSLTGSMSEQFEKDFGLSDEQITKLRTAGVNDSIYEAIEETFDAGGKPTHPLYGTCYYILMGPKPGGGNTARYTLIPVVRETGYLNFTMKLYYSDLGVSWTGNELVISDDDNKLKNNFQYLGTWWGVSYDSLINDTNGTHDTIQAYVDAKFGASGVNYNIEDPSRVVPANDWENVYSSTTLQQISDNTGLDISNVYSEYRSKTLTELASLCRLHNMQTGELLTYTNDFGEVVNGRLVEIYFISNTNVDAGIENGTDDDPVVTSYLKAGIGFITSITEVDELDVKFIDIPYKYQRTDGPLATRNISGNHYTLGLSMADANHNPYILYGLADTVEYDELTGSDTDGDNNLCWSDLVEALAGNKSIDILGEILKKVRMYVQSIGYIHGYYKGLNSDNTLNIAPTLESIDDLPTDNNTIGDGYYVNNSKDTSFNGIWIYNETTDSDDTHKNGFTKNADSSYEPMDAGYFQIKGGSYVFIGNGYIKIGAGGPRLYIATSTSSAPSDEDFDKIPEGSIGIGW